MEQIQKYFEQTLLSGGPSSLRVIAKIGGSNYDITVTKQEELDIVQTLINKFVAIRLRLNTQDPTSFFNPFFISLKCVNIPLK